MNRILFLLFLNCFILIQANAGDTTRVKALHPHEINLFSLADVQLLDGDFKHIMDLDHKYLLSIDPDRLASWFRREAGLTPKAPPYPYWESEDVWGKGPLAGHIMGFYLSSMSMMYQSTGDTAIINRLNYTLHELNECQQAQGDGYLLATINGRHVFDDVVAKNFTTSNPLINNTWEPVYIMNKIMLGLYGVYRRCDLPLAKNIFLNMADWFGDSVLNKLTHDDIQKLLFCEHGSINENYINAYTITGDKKYLNWATELNDEDMWVPLSEGKDILNGWHANTQIPKFTGFENVYDYTGDKRFTDAARFFWSIVTTKHTWSIGGNSTGEHFFDTKQFEERISHLGGPESCNSVNMLRLTEILYQDYAEPEKIDYYERVLYNHILANYDPEEGMCVYYTSMRPGHYKIYGTEYSSFWCCTGTGMESPAKFGQMIYAYDSSNLYVNLFIPSKINWKEKNIALVQNTKFPDENNTTLTVVANAPIELSIKIRHPKWLRSATLPIKINGKTIEVSSSPDGYATIKRVWKNGDKISIELNGKITVEPLIASDKYVSVLYGPVVMAAQIDNYGLTKDNFRKARQTVAMKEIPMSVAPSFIGDYTTIAANIIKQNNSELLLTATDKAANKTFTLIAFNKIHFDRYAVYFRHFDDRNAYNVEMAKERLNDSLSQHLTALTIDSVNIGDSASEALHKMEAVNSYTGGAINHKWRNAPNGGYFMYSLKALPGRTQYLYLSFQNNKGDTTKFDVYANGKLLQAISDVNTYNIRKAYAVQIPSDITNDQIDITIKLQARSKQNTGNVYDLRIIKDDFDEAVVFE
ncbi:MAG TPA: beta-L-arabinofuranosidase domain-containing protein [Parafilimonas sp.]|nr:beta-L-arabinofuranosidase domain-containing protein [Parafilimonas sp.]